MFPTIKVEALLISVDALVATRAPSTLLIVAKKAAQYQRKIKKF